MTDLTKNIKEPPKVEILTFCPKCGSIPKDHEVRNYNMAWHDGEIYCKMCGSYVRSYDAG